MARSVTTESRRRTYQFHAFVDGWLSVRIGDREVLKARTGAATWISGPAVQLSFGEHPLVVSMSAPKDEFGVTGRSLKLYWSSDSFPLEPLPHHVLFHTDEDSQARLTELGHRQLAAFACRRCHGGLGTLLIGPSLKYVGAGTSWAAIRERLRRYEDDPNHGRMPAFGLREKDADAVLAYLARHAEAVKLSDPPKVKVNAKETPSGGELLKSVGCLACHEWKSLGQRLMFGGGKLDGVASRRSRAWLDQWLRDPAAINPHHHMPVFKLTDAERQQIVTALSEDQKFPKDNDKPKTSDEFIERGRSIMERARCTACHEIPGPIAKFAPLPRDAVRDEWLAIRSGKLEPGQGCLDSQPDAAKLRPSFPAADAAAIAAALHDIGPLRPTLLETKNCLACHDRDGSRGLSGITLALLKTEPQWQGQTPTLVPPPLTAVGDKIQDAALAKAIRGEQTPRMPWLKVRMPRFKHTEEEAKAILDELIDHDRIPPNAPATPAYPIHTADQPADPQTLIAGRELTGGKGFSCIACHALKDYVPKQVALGTRGSDLYRLGDRMRPEFFFRWTRSPLRIVPGVEMPGYTRPHPTLLDGQLDRQLAAMWDALHDPNFTAPTNPAVVEQLWTLAPGDRPRIIRDVFTIPKHRKSSETSDVSGADDKLPTDSKLPKSSETSEVSSVESVPRAFAVGFPNGHSVLFDLDRGAVRAWTIGDFARQRTQGKSWFWDLAGVTVTGGMGEEPDVVEVTSPLAPKVARSASRKRVPARLLDYKIHADHVAFRYTSGWISPNESPDSPRKEEDIIEEDWRALTEQGDPPRSGWERTVRVTKPNYALLVPNPSQRFAEPQFVGMDDRRNELVPGGEGNFRVWSWLPPKAKAGLRPIPAITRTWRVRYLSSLETPKVALPAAPVLPVAPEPVTVAAGFDGVRLPLPRSIMPTAITWTEKGRLAFTSLKGQVFLATDTNGDGLEDQLATFAEGLAAPFGILQEDRGGLLVAHKPEVVLLRETDGDDRADTAKVIASGWGYTDDYHDWTTGIAEDSQHRYYIGLGSDYAHKNRPANESKWRGRILRFDLKGNVESVASELRYPVGLTIDDDDRLFCSDQQGVQNCFNELNYIQLGHRYGVPAKNDPKTEAPADVAAVQVPHPWTRSVNGIAFWPKWTGHPYAGQIVGAEFNHRALVRWTLQDVDGHVQGAVYPLSKFSESTGPENFLGPIAVAFSPQGDLYVGSLYDSGWLGGLNVGDIVKLTPDLEALPNGIREVRAIVGGFAIEFLKAVDRAKAEQASSYKLSGYTRVWGGEYATPDSGRHTADVQGAKLSEDGRTVELVVSGLKAGHVYDVSVSELDAALWPSLAHYTLTKLPR